MCLSGCLIMHVTGERNQPRSQQLATVFIHENTTGLFLLFILSVTHLTGELSFL